MMILSPSEPADHVPECNVLRRGCKSIADPIAWSNGHLKKLWILSNRTSCNILGSRNHLLGNTKNAKTWEQKWKNMNMNNLVSTIRHRQKPGAHATITALPPIGTGPRPWLVWHLGGRIKMKFMNFVNFMNLDLDWFSSLTAFPNLLTACCQSLYCGKYANLNQNLYHETIAMPMMVKVP